MFVSFSFDEKVDGRQRGRSPTVLGCGRLELKKRHRSPEKRDDRSVVATAGTHDPVGLSRCAEEHMQEAQRALGSGGKAGAQDRRRSAKRAGLRKSEQETALHVRYSELKRELKEIKRSRQQLEVARAEDREDVVTGDTLYGAAFVKPTALSAVQRQKRSRSGSRSSSVFRGARSKDHDPAARAFSRHTPFNGWPTDSARKVVGGIGGQWTALRWPPRTCTKSCNPCTLASVPETFVSSRPSRAADVATQRHKAMEMAIQDGDGKRASHLELLPDAKRLLTGRDEQELITRELRHEMRLRKFLDEGRAPWRKRSDAKGKGQEKGKHSDKGNGRPHLKGQSKGKSSDKSKAFEGKASPA